MKKSELIFNLISIPVDALTLIFAGIASFYLRQSDLILNLVGPIKYELNFHSFFLSSLKVLPILLLIFAVLGLYNLKGTRKFSAETGRIIVGTSLSLLIIFLIFFFNSNFFSSRFIILSAWGLGTVFVIFGRFFIKLLQSHFFRLNLGLHKLVVIGRGAELNALENIIKNPKHGYKIVGEYEYSESVFEILEQQWEKGMIDELLQANPSLPDEANLKLVQFARKKGLKFSFVPNLFEVQRNNIETDNFNGIPLISLKNTPLDGWGKVAKRILDIVASVICLIITSPVFLLISLAIKLDSKGRIIYAAPRRGQGKSFNCYKFRSMYAHLSVGDDFGGHQAERMRKQLWEKNNRGGAEGPFLKIKNDPRVTGVGKFLRRTKLDELPQFWNVLKGDMSMVGPRAHVLDEVEKYKISYARMFSIKPGVFGSSQIAQVSWPDLPFEEEIRLNTFYIENWSLWLDVKILAQSFWLLFFAEKPHEDY